MDYDLSTGQKAPSIEWEAVKFVSDAGEETEAERGWLIVPERHASPSGKTIRLPVLRFRTSSKRPLPPIIYLAGGPGSAGLSSARRDQYFPIAMAMREIADVVFFDQRGTGASEPSLALKLTAGLPANESMNSEASRAALATGAAKAAAEIRSRGIDLSAYNTDESADDVDALRRALGVPKISLWGHSYGSHYAFAIIRRHEATLDKVIVGGVNGPDQRWRYPSDADSLFRRIDQIVAGTPKLARQIPSVTESLRKGFRLLTTSPVTATVDSTAVHVGAAELQTLIILQSGESDFVRRLPMIASMIEGGQVQSFAPAIKAALKSRPLGTAMTYSMHIASGVSPERLRGIEKERAASLLGDAINWPWNEPGFLNGWGVTDLGPAYRAPLSSKVPTLFLTGTLDGRTSFADAERVRRGFSRSAHVRIEGASHDFYGETPAIRDVMLAFLSGKPVTDTTIKIDVEFHGPDESALIAELTRLAGDGSEKLLARVREMSKPQAPGHLTSYVIDGVARALARADAKSPAVSGLLRLGTELFPRNPVMQMRLGQALLAANDRTGAAAAYRRALELNPMLRFAAVQLAKTSD